MDTDLIAVEHKLERIKRLLNAEVMIDVIAGLLVSKGIITEAEIADATAKMKATEKYDYDVHEAEENIEVFNAMMDTCLKERARFHGLLNKDGTLKKLDSPRKRRRKQDEAE